MKNSIKMMKKILVSVLYFFLCIHFMYTHLHFVYIYIHIHTHAYILNISENK